MKTGKCFKCHTRWKSKKHENREIALNISQEKEAKEKGTDFCVKA